MDRFLVQWPATLHIQRARQEEIDDLTDVLKSWLSVWKTKGKHLAFAENILIYGNSIVEGQYDMVLARERPQFHRTCEQIYPAPDTKEGLSRFSIVICGKRHKTRF